MPSIVRSDTVIKIAPGQPPDYNSRNPLSKLLSVAETQRLAAERHFYLTDELHSLFPFGHLDFAGPQGADANVIDPVAQDNKTDFQKQSVRDFQVTDAYLLRGWVTPKAWRDLDAMEPLPEKIVPFLKLSYRAGPDSKLADALGGVPGPTIRLFLKVNAQDAGALITVPYNEATDRYEIELWGDSGVDLRALFQADGDGRALASLEKGELIVRPDLIRGAKSDFDREGKDDVDIRSVSPTARCIRSFRSVSRSHGPMRRRSIGIRRMARTIITNSGWPSGVGIPTKGRRQRQSAWRSRHPPLSKSPLELFRVRGQR